MKFTAQEEYGLRCLLQLARSPEGELTLPEISAREGISLAYVGKLMRVLRQGGVVKASRGQKGGYQLTQPASRLSVGHVLMVLGGTLYSTDFCGQHTGNEDVCVHNTGCSLRSLWMALDVAVGGALEKMMLADLLCSESEARAWAWLQPEGSPPGDVRPSEVKEDPMLHQICA
jgi:Rrf2 family protein